MIYIRNLGSQESVGVKYIDDISAKCDLLQEKGLSNFTFSSVFRGLQLSLTAFQEFDTKKSH